MSSLKVENPGRVEDQGRGDVCGSSQGSLQKGGRHSDTKTAMRRASEQLCLHFSVSATWSSEVRVVC